MSSYYALVCMATHPALIQFFRAILTAKRSLNLYPEGSKQAAAWAPRFRRALTDAVERGLSFPVGVGRDRFFWPNGELQASEPALEALRFDFHSRGIVSFSLDAAVVDWELRAFLELLCMPPEELPSVFGAPAYLRSRGVIGITVESPSLTGEPDYKNLQEETSGDEAIADARSAPPPLDFMEAFAESIVASINDFMTELVFDRSALVDWFSAIFAKGGIDALYGGVRILATTVENSVDREIRLQTILDAIFQLPHTAYGPLVGERLIPMSPYDLVAFNLLSQATEDHLHLITQYVPQERLMSLSTDMVEYTWETAKRQRLVEAVTRSLHQSGQNGEDALSVPIPADDPLLAELREEFITACHPEKLLERSIDILLSLVFEDTLPVDHPRPVGALTEAMHEALSLNMPGLCLNILREVVARTSAGSVPPEMEAAIAEIVCKAADPDLIALIAEPLRTGRSPERVEMAVEYLRLTGEAGIEAFIELLAAEPDRRVRARMCEVLTRVGASAISVLGEHASDPRWFLARNALNILGKIRQPKAVAAVTAALNHLHPYVRVEAIRAAFLIDSPGATKLVLGLINDPEPTVRKAVVNAIGRKGVEGNISALRKLILGPIQDPDDFDVKSEAINALVRIDTVPARIAVEELANRHPGLWARASRKLQSLAREALTRFTPDDAMMKGDLIER